MRVTLISFSKNPDMQYYLHNLGNALNAAGARCSALGSAEVAADVETVPESLGIPVPGPSLEVRTATLAPDFFKGLRWVRDHSPDVIHFVSSHTWNVPFALLLRAVLPCAVVHTVHDPVPHPGQKGQAALKAYNRVAARVSDALILHNRHQLAEFTRAGKIRCLVEVVTLGHFKALDFQAISAHDARSFLNFGRLAPYKGLDKMALLANELSSRGEFRITVAGRPVPGLDSKLLSDLKAIPCVDLIDRFVTEEEKTELFRRHSLLMLTNTSMTQSGVILDAFRHGRAVVCFDIPGVREQVTHGQDGYMVPAFDIAAMASCLVSLASDPDALNRMGIAAWETGKRRFSVEVMASETLAVYENAILFRDSRRPRRGV